MAGDMTQEQQADDGAIADKPRKLSLKEQMAVLEARHKKELAEIKARIKAEEQRQKIKDRKNDTRRKIIAGALALHHMEKNPGSEFQLIMRRLLNEYVVKESERALFGLSSLSTDNQDHVQASTDADTHN